MRAPPESKRIAADAYIHSLAHALLTLSTHHAHLTDHTSTLSTLRTLLAHDLQTLQTTLRFITSAPALAPPPASLPRQTADYARQTKQLLPKLQEYADRLAALPLPTTASAGGGGAEGRPASPTKQQHARTRSRGGPANPYDTPGAAAQHLASAQAGPLSSANLHALARAEDEVAALRLGVARLEARVRAYRDLPPEREEARAVVREREAVLAGLRERRDGGFEALVG